MASCHRRRAPYSVESCSTLAERRGQRLGIHCNSLHLDEARPRDYASPIGVSTMTLPANLRRIGAIVFLLVCASVFGQAQQESIFYNFTGGLDGSGPSAVIRDSSTGVFYG